MPELDPPATPEVIVVPNMRRPGAGREPEPTSDGAGGLLVFAPLEADEEFEARYLEDGVFEFVFRKRERTAFALRHRPAAGAAGGATDELTTFDPASGLRQEAVPAVLDALTVNVGGLRGGVGLRGAHDFATPEGWDTIYSGVGDPSGRPWLPSLTVRVETDWFRQPSEFRYALDVGEALRVTHDRPVGSVLFVPREELVLRLEPASEDTG